MLKEEMSILSNSNTQDAKKDKESKLKSQQKTETPKHLHSC